MNIFKNMDKNMDEIKSRTSLVGELESLGKFVKNAENNCPTILDKNKWTILRVDGHSFHTFTKRFKSKQDERMNDAMINASIDFMKEYNAVVAYVQSDEVSIAISPQENKESSLPFNGKTSKIITLSAGLFSTKFNKYLPKEFAGDAFFDCRAFQVDTKEDVRKVFRWRQLDAFRNGIYCISRMVVSDKKLHKMSTKDKIKLINKDKKYTHYKNHHVIHGTFIKKFLKNNDDCSIRREFKKIVLGDDFIIKSENPEWIVSKYCDT